MWCKPSRVGKKVGGGWQTLFYRVSARRGDKEGPSSLPLRKGSMETIVSELKSSSTFIRL
jgi:hypothetical protein